MTTCAMRTFTIMNALRTTVSVALASMALLLASSASAATTTQKRDLKGYTQIRLEGSLDLEIAEGSAYSFELTAKDSDQAGFLTEVEGDTLVIHTKPGFHWNFGEGAHARITLPELRGIHIQGSGDVTVKSLTHVHDLDIQIQGSGDVDLTGSMAKASVSIAGSGDVTFKGGSAQALDVRTSGSGDVEAKDLTAKVVNVHTSGSGDATVTVDGGPADFSTSGSGDIDWWGDAKTVQSHSSGSGDISHH